MLEQTFIHLPGVGPRTERGLWAQGCTSWQVFLDNPKSFSLGSASKDLARRELEKSQEALANGEFQFFRRRLKLKNAWRAWEAFESSTIYLDIETDGTQDPEGVTIVGLYDGKEFTALVHDDNMFEFPDRISHFSNIVTFYGSSFDLPVLQKKFPRMLMDQIHFDLCSGFQELGFHGGLKKLEKEFGFNRSPETDGLSGYDAVLLWRRHLRGQKGALERLIAYNREDVVNLAPLARICFDKLCARARGEKVEIPESLTPKPQVPRPPRKPAAELSEPVWRLPLGQ